MPDYHTDPTYCGLLAAILATPDDDVPRLVFADWIEERGDPNWAEFIRVQCALARSCWQCSNHGVLLGFVGGEVNQPCPRCVPMRQRERELWEGVRAEYRFALPDGWDVTLGDPIPVTGWRSFGYGVVRRGFVTEVRTTVPGWVGQECRECLGFGVSGVIGDATWRRNPPCDCGHTGRNGDRARFALFVGRLDLAGIGPLVCAAHPVERVVPLHREPFRQQGGWWRRLGETAAQSDINRPVFERLRGGSLSDLGLSRIYPTREAADEDLSDALLAWARAQPVPPLAAVIAWAKARPAPEHLW